jgi:hypothetical protein
MTKNHDPESIFPVNKIIEFAHDFFVRNDSNSRGREVMAKIAKKSPARKAKKPARKTAARKPAARKPAAKARKRKAA